MINYYCVHIENEKQELVSKYAFIMRHKKLNGIKFGLVLSKIQESIIQNHEHLLKDCLGFMTFLEDRAILFFGKDQEPILTCIVDGISQEDYNKLNHISVN